jgi:hypothetical protein
MKPTVIACVSDLHCGSSVALCPPKIAQDDGGEYIASKAQQWLWQGWGQYWKRVAEVRKAERASLIVCINGDLTDGGMHHGTTQLVSPNPTSQAAIVDATLHIPKKMSPDQWAIIRGTEGHVGQSACHEERIATGLRKDGEPVILDAATDTASHWHLKMEIDGVRLDFAHHGRVGSRPWTKPNVVANLAAEIFYDHAQRGEPHPHLAVRSHQHRFVDTAGIHPTRVVQTPAWQLHTAFIHRIAPGSVADIGGVILVIKNGTLTVEPVLYRPTQAPVWRPKP